MGYLFTIFYHCEMPASEGLSKANNIVELNRNHWLHKSYPIFAKLVIIPSGCHRYHSIYLSNISCSNYNYFCYSKFKQNCIPITYKYCDQIFNSSTSVALLVNKLKITLYGSLKICMHFVYND